MYKQNIKLYLIGAAQLLFSMYMVKAQNVNNAQSHTTMQSETVTGKVLDDYGKPLSDVKVSSTSGTLLSVTDDSGRFDIQLVPGREIRFEHAGFDRNAVRIKDRNNIELRMHTAFLGTAYTFSNNTAAAGPGNNIQTLLSKSDTANSDDTLYDKSDGTNTMYTLYGKSDVSSMLGSVATVSGSALYNTPAPQYTYALPGRIAGLNVIQSQGFYIPSLTGQTNVDAFVGNIPTNASGAGPTDNNQFNIQLRGHNASAGQSPVVIIDGVQRELYSIDPEDIESVTVLKDASSSLLLGQNSSRGALVVTTLQPKIGKPHLSFSAQTGFQESLKLPDPLPAYKYAYLLNEALQNDGKTSAYTAGDFDAYKNHTDPYGHPDVNWYNTILNNNAPITRYNLNVTGGTKTARYMVALGYLNQDGFFKTSSANSYNTNVQERRYTIDSKIDFNVNKDFDLGLNILGRLENNNQPGAGASNILSALLTTPNNAYPVYNPDGSYGGSANYTNNLLSQVTNSGYLSEQERDIMVNLDMTYRLDKWVKGWWIKAKGNISVQSASYLNRSKQAPVFQMTVSDAGDTSYARYGSTINQNNTFTSTSWARYWYAQASTGYDKQIGDHSFGAVLFYDQRQALLNYDLPSVLTNYAFKGNYNYQHKYFAEAGLDYGGYSRYQAGHRFGAFYAGALGWDIAQENFIRRNVKWIDQLKIRASYGKTGNANVDNYGYYIWNAHYSIFVPSYGLGSNYPTTTGAEENATLPNVNATWEKAKKLDIGADIALFDNHLQATFDYYHEKYYDVMQSRGNSIALIGANYPAENIGVDLYHGTELSLTYRNSIKDFNYFITGNASMQYSKVLFMDEQYEKYPWNVHTGLPVGQRFGLIADGFVQTPEEAATYPTIAGYTLKVGDVKYKDLNGDGIIDQFDVAPIGRTKPLIYYGLTLGFSYKGFELNVLIQGVQNRDIYVNNGPIDAGFQAQNNGYGQAYEQAQGRWTPETAGAAIYPRLTAGGNVYNNALLLFTSNSLFLHNGNYLRLKNAGIAYNLPYKWLKHLKVGGVKIFVNALNLLTWAAYDQVDPEISLSSYPLQRVINTGINIKL